MKLSKKQKILIIVIIGILIIGLTNLYSKAVRNTFYLISAPIQKVFWQTGQKISNLGETIVEIKNFKKENEELKLKNQQLLAEIALLKELKKENEILREALKIGLEKDFKLELAEVIGKDISEDFILINKGSKDGISKDLPVITQQKVLFGKIEEVYENFSKVMLISNKESVFDAKIHEKEIYGVVKGKGNLKIFFDLILSDAEIETGDILVTSALEGIFPKGLLVGEIKKERKSDIKPFQQAEVDPFFDISQIENLFIILGR